MGFFLLQSKYRMILADKWKKEGERKRRDVKGKRKEKGRKRGERREERKGEVMRAKDRVEKGKKEGRRERRIKTMTARKFSSVSSVVWKLFVTS